MSISHLLKLEIVFSNPALNEWEKEKNISAGQGLKYFYM